MKRLIITFTLLCASVSALAQTATVIAQSPLHQSASIQSAVLATLPTGTLVKTIKRSGGWKLVSTTADKPKIGWLRSYRVRQGTITIVNTKHSSGGFFNGLASLSRKASGLFSSKKKDYSFQTTATIGVRGLSEQEIKNARPNLKQLALLQTYQSSKKMSRTFAKQGNLKAISLAHLPKSKVEK